MEQEQGGEVVRVAVSGGVGVGKTSVVEHFATLGFPVVPNHALSHPTPAQWLVVAEVRAVQLAPHPNKPTWLDVVVRVDCDAGVHKQRCVDNLGMSDAEAAAHVEAHQRDAAAPVLKAADFVVHSHHTHMAALRAQVAGVVQSVVGRHPRAWEGWLAQHVRALPLQRQEVRCVVFDLDDTLWSVLPALARAERALAAAMEERMPNAARALRDAGQTVEGLIPEERKRSPLLAHDFTALRTEILHTLARTHGDPVSEVEGLMATWLHHRSLVGPDLFPDALPVLRELRRAGLRVGALSNGNCDLSRTPELASLLDFHLHAGELGCCKPHLAAFLALVVPANTSLRCVVMVGDDIVNDVQGPMSLGMRAVWFNHRQDPPRASVAPSATISSLSELPRVLGQWGVCM